MNWFDKLFDMIGAFCAMYLVATAISLVIIKVISFLI